MLTTNPHTAERQKEKVFHFIDTVDAQIRRNEDMNAFRNSDVYKLNLSKIRYFKFFRDVLWYSYNKNTIQDPWEKNNPQPT